MESVPNFAAVCVELAVLDRIGRVINQNTPVPSEIFEKQRFLDYIRHFVLWETDDGYIKKIAGYHQFHAVNKSVEQTIRASCPEGNKRIGVIWHTQGSGKSILMTFFAAKLRLVKEMKNPTLVIITDRNDLDGQLFSQFSAAKDLISPPSQATSRDHLKELLQVSGGGVVFSTIQKFSVPKGEDYPLLSDRHNIIVIADEAHRSQYDLLAQNMRTALPNAAFLGFTGTPLISHEQQKTREVFGEYVSIYNFSQSIEDGATVPLYYEDRIPEVQLSNEYFSDELNAIIDEVRSFLRINMYDNRNVLNKNNNGKKIIYGCKCFWTRSNS